MKKSIKTIAAALSAAVLAALPVSNALTANAARGSYVCRTTAFCKTTDSSFTYNLDIKCCRKGALHDECYKLGMIGGSLTDVIGLTSGGNSAITIYALVDAESGRSRIDATKDIKAVLEPFKDRADFDVAGVSTMTMSASLQSGGFTMNIFSIIKTFIRLYYF